VRLRPSCVKIKKLKINGLKINGLKINRLKINRFKINKLGMGADVSESTSIRGWIALGIAVVIGGALGLGGSVLPAEQQSAADIAPALTGRTSSVCTTGTLNENGGTTNPGTQVIGATARVQTGVAGSLTGRGLGDQGAGEAPLSIDAQGQGKVVTGVEQSIELTADGILAGASAGMVYSISENGEDRGLSLGPCVAPKVEQWFTGLGATAALRSQLVISNPDDRQAGVDLEFYSEDGLMSVPGGAGLIIPAGQSRTISLEDLIGTTESIITVKVRANVGRVAAIARDLRSDEDATPTGADWHPASVLPARVQVIPAIPGGPGVRRLIISNPGDRRAEAGIEIMGPEGPFAPVDANEVTIEAHSVAHLDISGGLAGQIGSVRVTSEQPVLTAVRSERAGDSRAEDIAIQTSQPPITGVGIAPAAVVDGAETELALSNGGTRTVSARVSVLNLDGVSLYDEEIPIPAGGSIERRVTQAAPAYIVVKAPERSQVYGGFTLRQSDGDVYGLAAAPLITPGLAGRGRPSVNDPRIGQS
jgi:hypothetical protein